MKPLNLTPSRFRCVRGAVPPGAAGLPWTIDRLVAESGAESAEEFLRLLKQSTFKFELKTLPGLAHTRSRRAYLRSYIRLQGPKGTYGRPGQPAGAPVIVRHRLFSFTFGVAKVEGARHAEDPIMPALRARATALTEARGDLEKFVELLNQPI